MPMSVKERGAVERKAKKFWESLSSSDRFELGDQLVLGDLNWRDWLHAKPSPGFWNAVDALRMNWETMSGSGGKRRHARSHGSVVRRREAKKLKLLGWLPASKVKEFNPDRYDFQWNADYSKFKPSRLLWWDDASYMRYQSEDFGGQGGKKRHAGGVGKLAVEVKTLLK